MGDVTVYGNGNGRNLVRRVTWTVACCIPEVELQEKVVSKREV